MKGYQFEVGNDLTDYKFCSVGPKGMIWKRVAFRPFTTSAGVYNLAFGDLNKDGTIDDLVVTDNRDAEKVLVTVAKIVIDFTDKNPDALIYVRGSTPVRTRRYQMGLNKYWHEIAQMFDIRGYTSWKDMEPFQSGKNYIAFVAKARIRNFIF